MNAKNTKILTDEQLVTELQNGNKEAMGELYSRYHMLVFAKCLSFVKNTDDASDLSQDVMIRVLEKIGSFKGDAKFSTWLYSVTFNYCTDTLRKSKGKYFESLNEYFEIEDQTSEALEYCINRDQQEQKAIEAITYISKDDQQLLIMKYQENKSIKEMQSMYNLSASAIKMRLLRAREKATSMY